MFWNELLSSPSFTFYFSASVKETVAGTRAVALAIPEPSGLKQGISCHGLGAQTYWPSVHKR